MPELTCEHLMRSGTRVHACGKFATWVLVRTRNLEPLEHLCTKHKEKSEKELGQQEALKFVRCE